MGGLCLHMSYQHIRLQPNPQRPIVEFSLINDPESDATFFYYPSPTSSMVVSLDYELVGWQQLLTDLVWLIYLKLVGNPCSLNYFTHNKCRWCLLNLIFVNKKVVNSINNSKNVSCIMLPTFFLWKKWSSILPLIPGMTLNLTPIQSTLGGWSGGQGGGI